VSADSGSRRLSQRSAFSFLGTRACSPVVLRRASVRFALALAALGLIALALRLWRLDALGGFDWDEVATVFIAARPLPDLLAYLRGAPFEHPPAYYLLAHAWLALGREEIVLRTLSALLGALTVPVVGALGAELFGRRVGIVAATLLALAPAHLFYSRDARMYSLLALLLALGLYALVRALRAPGTAAPWWALWAVASLLALATHYYAAFALGGQVLYLLSSGRLGRCGYLALGATLATAIFALVGWWALSPGLRHSLSGLALAPLTLDDAALSLWRAAAGLLRGPFSEEPPLVDVVAGGLALLLLALLGVAAWHHERAGTRVLLTTGLAPLLGLVGLMLVGRDLNVRFLVMLLPIAVLVLAGGGVALSHRRLLAPALVAAWALVVGPWLVGYYRDYVRGDYAAALREVEAAERPGETVVFNGPWQTLLFDHYYRGRLPAHILTGAVPLIEAQVAAALADLAARYEGVWLLETDMGHADPTEFVPRWLARYAYRGTSTTYRQVHVAHYLLPGPPLRVQAIEHSFGGVELAELAVEAGGPRLGDPTRIELVWRATEEYVPGVKVGVRVRDGSGGVWWGADPWLAQSWLPERSPRPGDLLHTRLAIKLPADAPASAYTLQVVVYGSTHRPDSGEGWVAWSSPPLLLPFDVPAGNGLAAAGPSGLAH
jgi:4-amino-4-deoxy-L-arabinose transferase-like glycosyltransferase